MWKGAVVKNYSREAPGQMAVLDVFQAKRWLARIDVQSLIPSGANGKRWVGATVKNLNRNLKGIRFHADGANRMILWSEA